MRLTLPEKSAIINMLSVFICGCGGIGRRARFRFWWLHRAGSSPVTRTITGHQL